MAKKKVKKPDREESFLFGGEVKSAISVRVLSGGVIVQVAGQAPQTIICDGKVKVTVTSA